MEEGEGERAGGDATVHNRCKFSTDICLFLKPLL